MEKAEIHSCVSMSWIAKSTLQHGWKGFLLLMALELSVQVGQLPIIWGAPDGSELDK